uniref:Uncharacterized protein n=1 Tax=Megaselia scalaris TaxID=36166 RepID=T1GB96_MEGSC
MECTSQNPTAPSPSFLYRPPSPWTPVAPSPPPIISGPRRNSMQSPGPMSPPPHAMSPGPQGLRGTRAGSQSRPHWSGPQPYGQQTQQQHYQPVHAPSPTPFNGHGPKPTYSTYSPINVPAHHPMSSFQLSPSPSPLIFQSQPPPEYFYQSPYGNGGSNSNHHPINRPQEYVGAPMEPPLPKSYVVYDDEEETGPSTREIIANQSQDYIDEKLAEYQMTILQLQDIKEDLTFDILKGCFLTRGYQTTRGGGSDQL